MNLTLVCALTNLSNVKHLARRIGTVARMELQKVLNNTVHLILDVKVLEPGRDFHSSLEVVGGEPLFL